MGDPEVVLSLRQAAAGRECVPFGRLAEVLRNAGAFGMHLSQGELGERDALLGEFPELGEGGGVVAGTIRLCTGKYVGPRRGNKAKEKC